MDETSLRVLLVDDERPIRRFLRSSFGGKFTIFEADTGEDALHAVAIDHPDIVLLDLGLPDIDGVEVTRRLREWTEVPIIIVSVRDQEQDKVAALDAGADDYLTKPFSAIELLARIRAALRHCARPEGDPIYQHGNLIVNLIKREVRVNNNLIPLTPTEYDILRALVRHPGRVLTHRQIIQGVWGENGDANAGKANAHLLRVNVSNLRRKIEADPIRPRHIVTEPGVGYRIKESE